MDALIPLALTLAPDLARWLSGDTAEAASAAISQAVLNAAGTSDPAAATAALQRDPALAAQLRVQLAQLATGYANAARAADLDQLATTLRAATPTATPGSTSAATAIAWSAPIVSAAVLLTFGVVMTLVLVFGMRPGSETTSNMLLGTLAAMATSVVSYWVGSSAGSARKDDRLAQLSK